MKSNLPRLILLLAAGAVGLGGAIAVGALGHRPYTVWVPLPLPYWVMWFCGVPWPIALCVPAGALLVWQPEFWRLKGHVAAVHFPVRTWVLLVAISLLSLLWFAIGYGVSVEHQGLDYARGCAWMSAGGGLASAIVAGIATVTNNFYVNVLAHTILFYWMATYAFPYLGEPM